MNLNSQIDLDDRILSLRRHLFRMYATGSIHINLQREQDLIRPMWSIQHINTSQDNRNASAYCDHDIWKLWYYGTTRSDVFKTMSLLEQSFSEGNIDPVTGADINLRRMKSIYAWRFGWKFPEPFLFTDSTSTFMGNVSPGSHSVRVSGIDLDGSESVASDALMVNLSTTNYFQIRIPRVPWSMPLFKAYNIYVDNLYQATVQQPNDIYATYTITNITQGGKAPIEAADSVVVRWKYLRVNKFSYRITEDEVMDGVFTGIVNLETEVQQERTRQQVDVMRKIQVTGVDTPYIITPLSHL